MFCALRNKLRIREKKKWDGRQTGGIYLWKANVLRTLEEDQQHAHWCFHNRVWRPKDVKTSENETVDGQNIQTLQHALRWTPAPPNLNVSARVLAKVMLGVWFFSSIGANAFQVTITLNFGSEGVVQDRRGLNISSIYGTNSCRTPQLVPSRSLMFSHLLVSKLCCGSINVHAADLLPKCAKHWLFTSKCLLSVSRPIFFYSLIRNLFQTAKNLVFSQVNAACVSRPIFSYSLIHNLFQHAQNMSLSPHFFLFPNSQLIPKCTKHCVFTGKCNLCASRPIFSIP